MDHVFKFMGKQAKGEFLIQIHCISVDHKHLMTVGEFFDLRVKFIGGWEISGDRIPKTLGKEDVNMRIFIHPRGPFRAEKSPIGGIDLGLESLR